MKNYITLAIHMVSRDIRERYAGSYFGIMWNFLYPLFFLVIYWFVFSKIMQIRVPGSDESYLPFLFSGLLPWYAIQDGIMRGTSSLVDKGYIIKKVLLPHELFPISANIAALIHHSIGFVLFLVIYYFWKGLSSVEGLSFLPLLYTLQLIFSIGWSLLLSSIAIYFRDLMQIIGIALQGVFFLSPILYPPSAFPKELSFLASLNPLTPLLNGYRTAVIAQRMPDLWSLSYFALFAIIITALGLATFRRLRAGFVDVL